MSTWNNSVPSRDDLHQAKREAMLREAIAAFNQKGFHATSMVDIGKSLGVTKATLYYYFPDKHALLSAAFEHALDVAFESLERAVEQGGTGLQKLQHTIQGYLEAALSELNRCVILTEEHALRPQARTAIIRERDRFENALRDFVGEGIEDGSIIPCDPKLAVFSIFGAVNWVPKWYFGEGPWTSSQLSQAMSELLCRSIAAHPQSSLTADVSVL